jgi:hypothetical protein
VEAPIRGVQVDEDVGIPLIEHHERCLCLRRLCLDVVAIEVVALTVRTLCVRPLADHLGSILGTALAVLREESLVAVSVVDGHGDQHDRIEHVGARREGEVAQQRLQRLLSLYFTRVNVALHVHDQLAARARLCRGAHERA